MLLPSAQYGCGTVPIFLQMGDAAGKITHQRDPAPIPPLSLGEGRVRARERTGGRLQVRCCPTLM
jgi:hypothetical protein